MFSLRNLVSETAMSCNSASQDPGIAHGSYIPFRIDLVSGAVEVADVVSMFCEGWFVVWSEIRGITV
jgi:hypothetical protein